MFLAVAALPLAGGMGCQSAHVPNSVVMKFPGDDAQLDFWHELAGRSLASNDDAFHGLLLYLDSTDPCTSYGQRVATLKSRGLLPAGFSEPADVAVSRGTLAVAICKVLNIHGGLAMHVVGPVPRYAVRELVYAEVFPPSSPQQTFSGTEFVGVIGKIEDTQRAAEAGAAR